MACKRLGDPDVVHEELIPSAKDALATPDSERMWHRALPALLWAYDHIGEPEKTVQRGQYWLQQAKERSVSLDSLSGPRLRIARAFARTDQAQQAAEALREIIPGEAEGAADIAQKELIMLSRAHPDIGEVFDLSAIWAPVSVYRRYSSQG